METIFEDDVGEVGSEIEGYCSKCRTDTRHVVLTRYEAEVRSVQCNICGSVHMHRPSRGEPEEEMPEPIALKRRQALRKLSWEEALKTIPREHIMPYDVRARYREGMGVVHPKFGRGYVSEMLSDTKMEATFKDGRRVLVYNRSDLPGAPKVRGKIPTPPPPPAPPVPEAKVRAQSKRQKVTVVAARPSPLPPTSTAGVKTAAYASSTTTDARSARSAGGHTGVFSSAVAPRPQAVVRKSAKPASPKSTRGKSAKRVKAKRPKSTKRPRQGSARAKKKPAGRSKKKR